MKTIELFVNSTVDLRTLELIGGDSSEFVVVGDSKSVAHRRVWIASILHRLGSDQLAIKVKVRLGMRDKRIDVVAIYGKCLLLVAYATRTNAQKIARQLFLAKSALISTVDPIRRDVRGVLIIESDGHLAGELNRDLDGWARIGTSDDLLTWSLNDLLGQSKCS